MEQIFTSTGIKLLHHPEAIKRFKSYERIATPISLQIAPTSRCQLSCVFCSNANRKKHEDLNPDQIKELIVFLKNHGLKTVEWTGGGDPTMYRYIAMMIGFCQKLGLKQGFITNGIALDTLPRGALESLSWIRISMNCLDYVDDISIPELERPVLGFSYVINKKTTNETWIRLDKYVSKYSPNYVRIVPDCRGTKEEQIEKNLKHEPFVARMGFPYFYQAKTFERVERCWWCYFKPFLLHDGWVYPCSSVVLNSDSEGVFHQKYRWTHMSNLLSKYGNKAEFYSADKCTHCVFSRQNIMVDSLINPNGMESFI